ncbi:MAG: hypothetical protein HWQ23_03580 [Nostoc sp. JL33]|uniref:hypothetical protein n=1 Tax=Nostoc sp. JL33 TaxID=2815396 RepID=UPI0025CFAD5A|nr:hypothetical protein [Nostoc sp. JL33]MBN3869418.1 hypothetical protein [Nostoc sp. JL33]
MAWKPPTLGEASANAERLQELALVSHQSEKIGLAHRALRHRIARRRHRQKILSFVKHSHPYFNQILSLPSEKEKQTRSRG